MNKKGFTLIELLAVIVVLAIIALITVPIIANIIGSAKKSVARSNMLHYVKALEDNNAYADSGQAGYNKIIGVKNVNDIKIKTKGSQPTKGTATINSDGNVTYARMVFNGYWVEYNGTEATTKNKYTPGKVTVTYILNGSVYATKQQDENTKVRLPDNPTSDDYDFLGWFTSEVDGEQVTSNTILSEDDVTYYAHTKYNDGLALYFDPVTTNKCDKTTFSVDNIVNGTSTCYKWRVISDDGDNITVQLDHNLIKSAWMIEDDYKSVGGSNYEWNMQIYIKYGPKTALNNLANATSSWTRVSKLNYTYDTSAALVDYGVLICENGICKINKDDNNITIAGSSSVPVRARLITAEELQKLTIDAGASEDSIAATWTLSTKPDGTSSSGYNVVYYFTNEDWQIGTLTSASNNTGSTKLSWLVENTFTYANNKSHSTTNVYGMEYNSYWTLSPIPEIGSSSQRGKYIGRIDYLGRYVGGVVPYFDTSNNSNTGLRPVITMPRSVFN